MLDPQQVETLITIVSAMDRGDLTERFLHFHGQFPVDFTPEYLRNLPTDRLKHIFVAMCLQAVQLPSEDTAHAA